MKDKHIALYGGAFDPPHIGHSLAVMWLLSTQDLDRVWILPAYKHPSNKEMAPFEHRMNMCKEAFGVFEGVSVREEEKQAGGEGYTLNLIKYLKEKYPKEYKFHLVVGADNYADRRSWYKWEEVEALVEDYIVIGRAGSKLKGAVSLCDICSTDIREALSTASLVGKNEVVLQDVLVKPVFEYILDNNLYGADYV